MKTTGGQSRGFRKNDRKLKLFCGKKSHWPQYYAEAINGGLWVFCSGSSYKKAYQLVSSFIIKLDFKNNDTKICSLKKDLFIYFRERDRESLCRVGKGGGREKKISGGLCIECRA